MKTEWFLANAQPYLPAWTAGFASTSDSYNAWIGSEEVKQTSKAVRLGKCEFHLSAASGCAGSFMKETSQSTERCRAEPL